MVITVESEGILRPLEVGGCSRANRVDLPKLVLPLACGELSHASPKDQEVVLDLGETVPMVVVVLVLGQLFCVLLGRGTRVETMQNNAL